MKHQLQTEIIINAPKEKVYGILTDLTKYAEWNPFIVHSEGVAKTGNTIRNTMKNGEKLFVFKPKVLVADENKAFEWLGSLWFKGLFDGHHYFHIEELADNQVRFIQGEKFGGILVPMILKRIGEQTRQNFISLNNALKERAESV